MLNGGEYRGRRILQEATVRLMLINYNAYLKTRQPESDHGLGFAMDRHAYMGALSSPVTFGHTGFTGPSLVVDPLSHSFVILLSNRVHPDHTWGDRYVAGHATARDLGDAMPVRPPLGGAAWRAERCDGTTVTLTAPLRRPVDDAAVASFLLWYDTEPGYDVLRFETSSDGGMTWLPGAMTLRSFAGRFDAGSSVTGYGGRRWWHVSVPLPSGTTHVRWSYATDSTAQGRGVYIDWVLVFSHGRLIFNGEAGDADRFEVNGWVPART
jgi:hypothetical protein